MIEPAPNTNDEAVRIRRLAVVAHQGTSPGPGLDELRPSSEEQVLASEPQLIGTGAP